MLATAAGAVTGFRLPFAHAADYRGKFFVVVQADGGWDVTSFCDPKVNQKGQEVINHWAEGLSQDDVPEAGNIPYAPFANNEAFFQNHYDKMLVINGVDAQTNSHTAGVVHNWSGRIAEGYPTLTALSASQLAPDLPIAYISFGGYAETGRLTRYTRLDNPDLLRNVAYPRGEYYTEEAWRAMEAHREARIEQWLAESSGLLPAQERNLDLYQSSMESSEGLEVFADAIPPHDQLKSADEIMLGSDNYGSELARHAQLAVLAFKTGVAVSADLYLGGFDTHARNDPGQRWLLGNLTNGVDYLWDYAEEHGMADRMVVVMGSDFGRTNKYNSDDGKDHWPYGSYIVMEKNQPWTNRVVGETNELHYAYNIDPATLKRVDDNDPTGTHIYPKHVHKALRRYLGVENTPGARRFPFNNTEDFPFFSS